MPEVITSPAPIVGYNPPWIAAQMNSSSLEGAIAAGNAFARGVDLNIKRQKMEQAFAKLDLENEKLKYQRDIAYDKVDLADRGLDLKAKQVGNAIYMAGQNLDLREQRLDLDKKNADYNQEVKLNQLTDKEYEIDVKDRIRQRAADYGDALSQITAAPGTADYVHQKALVDAAFADARLSPEGSRAHRQSIDLNNAAYRAQDEANKQLRFQVDDLLKTGSRSPSAPTMDDLQQPDNMWGKDKKSGNRFIVRRWDPSLNRFERINPGDAKAGDKLDYRTLDNAHYRAARGISDKLLESERDFSKRPTYMPPPADDQGYVRVIAPDGRKGRLPASMARDYIENRGYTVDQ